MDSPRPLFKIGFGTHRKNCRFQPNGLRYTKYLCKQDLKTKKAKKQKNEEQSSQDTKLTKLENSTFPTISTLIKSQLENSTQIKRLIVNKQPFQNAQQQPHEEKTNVFLKFLELRLRHLQNRKTKINNHKNSLGDDQNNSMNKIKTIGNLESHNKNNANKSSINNTQENNKKINYRWDPRFTSSVPLSETLKNVNPGLVLNLYINCFSFFHENLCHSYDYPFKPLFESIINGRINNHLFRTIRKNKSKFYNGYLVVDIVDYRHRMSNRLAKPDIAGKIMNETQDKNQQQPQQPQQQQPQQQQQQQQQQTSLSMASQMNREIKHEPLNRSTAKQPNQQIHQQPQHSIKRLQFDERTDKKRKVLLSLDEETFRIVVASMEFQEYSFLRNIEARLSRSRLNPKQQNQQNFGRTQKQLQRLARWGSEKQSIFQQKLLLVRSPPTCFESSIDIFKIANYYYYTKFKTNYSRKKILDPDHEFHHKKEIINQHKLIKKISNLNYHQHQKKILNLDYEKINLIKFKLKKKEREKLRKKQERKYQGKGNEMEAEMEMEMETEMKMEIEKKKELKLEPESESESDICSGNDTDTDRDFYSETEDEQNQEMKQKRKKKRKRKKHTRFSRRVAMMEMIEPLNTKTSGIGFIFKPKKKYKGLTIFRPLLSQRKKLISEQSFSEYIRRLTDPIGGSVNSNLQKFLIKRAKDTNKTLQNEKYTVYYKKNPFMIEQCHSQASIFTEEQIEKMKQIKEIEMGDIRTRANDAFHSHHHSPLVQIYSSVARPSIYLSVESNSQSMDNTTQSRTSVSDHATIPMPNNGKPDKSNIIGSVNSNSINKPNNNQINLGETALGENSIIDRQIFNYVKPEKNESATIKLRVDPESGIHEIDVTFKIGNKGITKTKTTGERVQTKNIFNHYHQFMKKNGWKQKI
ncbi:phd zinc finger-containing protein-related [Anaeramoeba flamelloides]|uniref:Phd zinc finger-containing protein-related n=1 Tax=Anaeramoeba flamelloides TaxID=1746091 RepID=A0ABQ8YZE8_9EUKA|nr:phd zinc finger-containing protein-related [Anaeramoeba flamelloides]